MLNIDFTHLISPKRQIKAAAKVYDKSSTFIDEIAHDTHLRSIQVDRVGEFNKFFGFGISQKATVKIAGTDNYWVEKDYSFEIQYDDYHTHPTFYVSDVKFDTRANEMIIEGYDLLAVAEQHTVSEIPNTQITIQDIVYACADILGVQAIMPEDEDVWDVAFEGNFSGKETFREVLDDIAEITQTVYFITNRNEIKFVFMDYEAPPVYTIQPSQYFSLSYKDPLILVGLCATTDLGDNIETATDEAEGEIQYIRNNAFWSLSNSLPQLLTEAKDRASGLESYPFNCVWRGNYALEPGDKIEVIDKDGGSVISYLFNDTITYNGGLQQVSKWEYTKGAKEHSSPATLGEVLNETTARVDKANKEIELLASSVDANSKQISTLQITTNSINAAVEGVQKQQNDMNGNISTLTEKVNMAITQEQLDIEVSKVVEEGVSQVRTGKNFTFDDEGLTISDINTDTHKTITTTISNNGMTVDVDSREVLKANDEGVKAKDLHADTYLIIGTNSRFENYKSNRTACFWIGG